MSSDTTSDTTLEVSLPDYKDPNKRTAVGKGNDLNYEYGRRRLQNQLSLLTLPKALVTLHEQQADIGFICDDLSLVRYFQCYGNDNNFFIGQYNPRRANRSQGSGRTVPPPGVEIKGTPSTKCFLCAENVRWQSRGIQLYYQFEIGNNIYNAMCNPFPFMPNHITISAAEHEPQSWHETVVWKGDKITRIVTDLYDVAYQLPGFVCFYNGVGAGASIEEHFHFQAFKIPNGHGQFPLQQVAAQVNKSTKAATIFADDEGPSTIVIDTHIYPLTAFRISGDRDSIIRAVVDRIKKWSSVVEDSASANITAIWEGNELVLYLIPRNRFYSRSIGLAGIVGGLEVLGEFIFCTEEENDIINAQRVNFNYMATILMGVKPPNTERLSIH